MIKFFKIISISEGVSAIMLFLIAMPLKYIFGNPVLIRPIGSIHGFLFVVYCLIAIYLWQEHNWNLKKFFIIILGSIIPGGTFYIDKKYFS